MDISQNPAAAVESRPPLTTCPRVSVIVPVYNGADTLPALLAALQQQTYPPHNLEVIVADNNSTDGSDQLVLALNQSSLRVVYERHIQNAGAARNQAIAAASGDIFAFTDADCIPAPDWIEQGIATLLADGGDRIAGAIAFAPLAADSSAAALLDALYNLNQQLVVETFQAAVTANLFVKRSVFDQVGPFPTSYFEDMQWNRRASAAGFSLRYAAAVVVQHPPRASVAALWEKGRRSGRGVFAICQSENRGGWLGLRHLLRMGRLLLVPRTLQWQRLPFAVSQLSLRQRLQIVLLMWLTINLGETWGYGQWLVRSLARPAPQARDNS